MFCINTQTRADRPSLAGGQLARLRTVTKIIQACEPRASPGQRWRQGSPHATLLPREGPCSTTNVSPLAVALPCTRVIPTSVTRTFSMAMHPSIAPTSLLRSKHIGYQRCDGASPTTSLRPARTPQNRKPSHRRAFISTTVSEPHCSAWFGFPGQLHQQITQNSSTRIPS